MSSSTDARRGYRPSRVTRCRRGHRLNEPVGWTGDAVTRKTATHLRLHVEESPRVKPPQLDEIRSLQGLCEAFQRVTGLSLQCGRNGCHGRACVWSRSIGEATGAERCVVSLDNASEFSAGTRLLSDEVCDQETAQELAASIADLLQELQQTRCAPVATGSRVGGGGSGDASSGRAGPFGRAAGSRVEGRRCRRWAARRRLSTCWMMRRAS